MKKQIKYKNCLHRLLHIQRAPLLVACALIIAGINNLIFGAINLFKFHSLYAFIAFENMTNALTMQRSGVVIPLILGLVMVALGRGLLKQRRSSWYWSLLLLLISAVNSLFIHTSLHIAMISILFIFLLIIYRTKFQYAEIRVMRLQKRIAFVSIAFALCYGIIGTYLLRDQFNDVDSWLDASYYTIATYSTVGYGDIKPLTSSAKFFSITMIIIGIGSFFTGVSVVLGPIIQKNVRGVYRMVSGLKHLSRHVVICGDNVLTRNLAAQYKADGLQCFFIENDEPTCIRLENSGFNVIRINPFDDQALIEINIKKAKVVLAAFDNDADNILVVMATHKARQNKHNASSKLIARIEQEYNIEKARSAGADLIISPLRTSAIHVHEMVSGITG